MRFWSSFTDKAFLRGQQPPIQDRRFPTAKVCFEFCLPDGTISKTMERWALVDTGSDMTSIPARELELFKQQGTYHFENPIAIKVRGLHGAKYVAVYLARVSILGQMIPGPYCEYCSSSLQDGYCASCSKLCVGVFKIAAVEGLRHPVIGMDLLSLFLVVADPWQKTIAMANQRTGRNLSWLLRHFRGTTLTPLDWFTSKDNPV